VLLHYGAERHACGDWLFVKCTTDCAVVLKITAPPEAEFKSPIEWRLTAAVPALVPLRSRR
jgi:hypothetical protein